MYLLGGFIFYEGVLILLAVIFWSIGYGIKKVYEKKTLNCCEEAVATVVEIQKRSNEYGKSFAYYPVVAYEVEGKAIKVVYHIGNNSCKYVIGQELKIKYDPTHPNRFLLQGERTVVIMAKVFRMVGYILIAIAILSIGVWYYASCKVKGLMTT